MVEKSFEHFAAIFPHHVRAPPAPPLLPVPRVPRAPRGVPEDWFESCGGAIHVLVSKLQPPKSSGRLRAPRPQPREACSAPAVRCAWRSLLQLSPELHSKLQEEMVAKQKSAKAEEAKARATLARQPFPPTAPSFQRVESSRFFSLDSPEESILCSCVDPLTLARVERFSRTHAW